ncbi:Na(+)/H(+) antiporter subunit F1 [Mammaliicoccus stepanovicii]|uniref:Putative monovalent cation/H+ antiporter subunit F n=1 Tax=Mammaliicoccus stepanovicii TaxID=643214 RepID=A0A239ZUY8_9STAP|nr:Na(+)/H(+) antiporter subunit F1 [Mammaliicoccus stepanovicii]PNZ77501.1 Na(+)/H(+) antiporter subunit F [Mammaliicoccus stepanovicii]GGI38937.1 Na(+)/H(+) antiporter subunit F1 [Mammaliicoccus stepanovicii]SNV74496.1 putative monovalent cation/H+ antiporter subunit F [Mammaliicoccus stepanovicii]
MTNIFVIIAIIIVAISMIGILIRVILGPTLADRVIALDALGITLMAIIALFSVLTDTTFLFVILLLIGILAFLGTAAFAKFMDKGEIIENDRDDTY